MKKLFLSVVLLISAVAVDHLYAQLKIYMKLTKLDGTMINGESLATGYVNWVELNASGQSHETAISFTGTGNSIGKTTPSDFSFQAPLNAASLPLMALQYPGSRLKAVDVWYIKTGCNCAYYKIHMEDVFITSIKDAVDNDGPVSQEIKFAPTKYAFAYYKQNPATGAIPTTPTNTFGWDRAAYSAFNYSF